MGGKGAGSGGEAGGGWREAEVKIYVRLYYCLHHQSLATASFYELAWRKKKGSSWDLRSLLLCMSSSC